MLTTSTNQLHLEIFIFETYTKHQILKTQTTFRIPTFVKNTLDNTFTLMVTNNQ